MEKISKKEIRKIVADLIEGALHKVNLVTPSEKIKKELIKLSKKFSNLIQDEIKKQVRQQKKAVKVIDEKQLLKKLKKSSR